MKAELITAFLKRFSKVDDKIKALYERATGSDAKVMSIASACDKIAVELAEDKKGRKLSAEETKELHRRISSISSKYAQDRNAIFESLSEHKKLAEAPKAIKGKKGDPGKSIKGDPGEDGRGIEKLFVNFNKHWIVIYTDGTRVDLGKIVSETIYQGGGGGGISIEDATRISRPNVVFVDSSMSPYTAIRPRNGNLIIVVDDSADDVDIILYPKVLKDIIEIKQIVLLPIK